MKNSDDAEVIILKACNGDRAKNLDAIAGSILEALPESSSGLAVHADLINKIRGWCEQLRIIADEIREKENKHTLYRIENGALYAGDDLLGEFQDGKFVPSKLLLCKSVAYQRKAHWYAHKHKACRQAHNKKVNNE